MPKRTAVLAAVFALVIGVWAGWLSRPYLDRSGEAANPMRIAQDYAATHYPAGTFQPNGAMLAYEIEDHRDVWTVTLRPQGFMGGGLNLMIRQRDGKVIKVVRTQ